MWRATKAGLLLLVLLAPIGQPQAIQLFRTPVAPQISSRDLTMSCVQLERELVALTPLTYSYKPGFYNNPYQGGAIFLGTVGSPYFYLYSVYDYYLDYREKARIQPAENRIETLRRLKADRHCFES